MPDDNTNTVFNAMSFNTKYTAHHYCLRTFFVGTTCSRQVRGRFEAGLSNENVVVTEHKFAMHCTPVQSQFSVEE